METEEILMKEYEQEDQKVKFFLIKEKGADVGFELKGCTFRIECSSTWTNFNHANAFYNNVAEMVADGIRD